MKLCKFMMKVPDHFRAPFCFKRLNPSAFFKLTSLKTKRLCGRLYRFCRTGVVSPRHSGVTPPLRLSESAPCIKPAPLRRVNCTKVLERRSAHMRFPHGEPGGRGG